MFPLTVVLVRPRLPENIGMAARACANMGVRNLILIEAERWEYDKAAPLATGKGLEILDSVCIMPSLAEALAQHTLALGTTARTGGWRSNSMPPRRAATAIAAHCREAQENASVALVFGPEDRGLENTEIALCTHLVTIPTVPEASSLNLAQAILILLYECFTASLDHAYHPERTPKGRKNSRMATIEEQEMLFASLESTLSHIRFLPKDNPEWSMQALRHFVRRAVLQRHEFDLFMGMCRHIMHAAPKNDCE